MLSLFWEAGACSRHSSPVIFRKTMCEIALAAPVSHCVLFLTGIVFDFFFFFVYLGCLLSVVIARVLSFSLTVVYTQNIFIFAVTLGIL